ncbi:O-antigen/teichoic acid export membrane protein [Pedobacter sp. CG_S7]|uniref:hypothetical protein n=1 Tax=Pedobacter sp. CG_S7 TaxID=3143930 RepID=UPI003392AE74
MISKIKQRIFNGDERSVNTKKSIFSLFAIRALSIPISFILVPITIGYVNSESYGIWLTISSLVAWMSFFDIGINNGLRNKLTESVANGNEVLSKKYVSTTYAILGIISLSLFICFFIINHFINWAIILNTNSNLSYELSKVFLIVVGYFCVKFTLSTVNVILLSHQLPAKAALRGLIEQLASLIVILFLVKFSVGSLLNLAYGLCIAPVLILLYYNFELFKGKFRSIRPSVKDVDFSLTRNLMGIGFKFFIIQIAGIIQFQTANFIIIRFFGPEEVTVYNIVFKYFSILTLLMGIFMTPFWSAVTDAFARKDYKWIIKAEKRYKKIAVILTLLGFVMLLLSDYAYGIWLGKNKLDIPFQISITMFLFTVISFFGGIYCTILNGISELDLQFKISFASPIIFLLLSYIFINYFEMGIVSIIFASIISNFNAYVIAPLQFRKIFKDKKTC